MKKILLTCLIHFFIIEMYAQKDLTQTTTNNQKTNSGENIKEKDTTINYCIVYDFKQGKYIKGLMKPKVDRPVVYKIININRLAFDVKVNPNDEIVAETDWFTSATELEKITKLVSETSSTTKVENAGGEVSIPENTKITKPQDFKKSKDEIKQTENNLDSIKKLDKLYNDLAIIKRRIDQYYQNKNNQEMYKEIYNDTLYISKIKNSAVDIKADSTQLLEIKNQIKNITILKDDKLDAFKNASQYFKNAYEEFIKSYDKVNEIIKASNKVMPVAHQPFLTKKEYVIKFKKDFDSIFKILNKIDISPNILNSQYTNLLVSYNKLTNIDDLDTFYDKASLKKYYRDIDLLLDNAKKIKFKEELIDFEKLSDQVKRVINLLEKEETYEFVSKPVQPKNDLATFDVEITSKSKDIEVNNSRKFKHTEFVRRGTRIDFSIGLAGSYFGNTKVYEIYTDTEGNKIGKKSDNLTVPSLIGMITMTSRSSNYLAIGGSAGLGIDVTNGKIQMSNFFIGPTLILGKYDRMMFTSGVTLRNVGKLKTGFEEGAVLTQINDVNGILSDDYKVGFFMALTYNLTKNVRDKISNY